jgi:hypothetical protein
MRHAARAGLLLAALLCVPLTASATTATALTNRALAEGADVIATGRCVGVRSAWEGRTLVTVATIAVSDVLKGEAAGTISVVLPGGVDARRRFPVAMVYAGAPQIAVNEEVFLFLAREEGITSGLTVMGFSQGKFSIVDGGNGKEVSRDLTALELATPSGTRRGTATRISLADFRRQIARYLQQP